MGHLLERHNCLLQTSAVVRGITGSGWAKRAALAEGEIAAQNSQAPMGECFSERPHQRCLRVSASPMSQYHAVAVGRFRNVKKSAHGWFEAGIGELAYDCCHGDTAF